VCVCVCEREREREREREGGREGDHSCKESGGGVRQPAAPVCTAVQPVCVREKVSGRDRERVRESLCERELLCATQTKPTSRPKPTRQTRRQIAQPKLTHHYLNYSAYIYV
jgi:hypothetical protein